MAVFAPVGLSANLVVGSPFSDGMVVQQGKPLVVWGWDSPGTGIKISLAGREGRALAAAGGHWQTEIAAPQPGGPYELVVKGSSEIRCKGVLSGEVWLASGQSNMVMPLRDSSSLQEALETAENPRIRFFQVERTSAATPRNRVNGRWTASSRRTAPGFSGVAYHFAERLERELNMPVGIIEAAWGGSGIYAWTPQRVMEEDTGYVKLRQIHEERASSYRSAMEEWTKNGEQGSRPPSQGGEVQQGISNLDNGMLHPVKPYPIRGVIWYQGEADAIRAAEYKKRFADLVGSWREDWSDPKLPVYLVQLPAFGNPVAEKFWPAFRNAQRESAMEIPNVDIAITIDSGDGNDIHPADKKTPGLRLAQVALAGTYGKNIVPGGPLPKRARLVDGAVEIEFGREGSGLELRGSPAPPALAVMDEAGKSLDVPFSIQGTDRISARVPVNFVPVSVRYAWHGFPAVTLYNKEGFPASPFELNIAR